MKLLKRHLVFASRLSLSLLIFGAILITWQQKSISNSPSTKIEIPTTTWQNTRLPDWNQITFSKMPTITESGSFKVPNNVTSKLGYDPSRSWNIGQKPDSFTMLGDFQDSFKLQEFTLADISQIIGSNLQETDLSRFGVIRFQTIDSLVKAIPDLKEWTVGDVKPILDLLSQNLSESFNANQTIGNLLNESPHLGKLNFESLDLKSYNLDSIPGLSTTPIASFDKWHSVYINEVPGLSDVPFSQFPNPTNPVGMEVGILDVAFATDEQKRNRTISGSDKEGFAVPCDKDCAHIELSGSESVKGKAWISGKYQLVKGGKGILGSVNGGKEPTGRNLFGDAFKVAVWDVSEVDGKVSQSLFFRVCMRNNFIDLGCTPYFIGPVPFMTYREKEAIFLGTIDSKKNGVSTPTGLKSSGFTFNNEGRGQEAEGRRKNCINRKNELLNSDTDETRSLNLLPSKPSASCPLTSAFPPEADNLSNLMPVSKQDCKNIHSSGTNLDALSSALSDVEDNYNFVGQRVCDSSGNCGRALGAMRLMSNRPDVRKIIANKSSGRKFLEKLDAGETVTSLEMTQYFSPQEQHSLMESETSNLLSTASQQTDPTTDKPFAGDRLVERVSQMHFAGVNIPIDSQASNLSKGITVKKYGEDTNYKYKHNLKTMDCL